MFSSRASLREVRREYQRYRRLYFLAEYPEMLEASEIIICWGDLVGKLGETTKVEVGPASCFKITLAKRLKTEPRHLTIALMHEQLHVANWRLNHGPEWDAAVRRLGERGAMVEFL